MGESERARGENCRNVKKNNKEKEHDIRWEKGKGRNVKLKKIRYKKDTKNTKKRYEKNKDRKKIRYKKWDEKIRKKKIEKKIGKNKRKKLNIRKNKRYEKRETQNS